ELAGVGLGLNRVAAFWLWGAQDREASGRRGAKIRQMKTRGLSRFRRLGFPAALLVFLSAAATAKAAQDVLDIDLSPLIDRYARYPTRFAVDLPHQVTIADTGTWTQNGTRSTWTY